MISKPLKFEKKSHWFYSSDFYIWYSELDLVRWYRRVIYDWFLNPCYQIKRLWQWYWHVFHNDYDFDAHCLYKIMSYKLQRVEASLLKGYATQEPKDMKALKVAIKLLKRLDEDHHEEFCHIQHVKKWGESKYWTTPCEDGSGSSWFHSSRPNANTPEEKEQERTEWLDCYRRAALMRQREAKWAFSILVNNIERLWD